MKMTQLLSDYQTEKIRLNESFFLGTDARQMQQISENGTNLFEFFYLFMKKKRFVTKVRVST